jgi:hypothetical protein
MNSLSELSDKRLLDHIARLELDIQNFEHRASLEKIVLERQDRFSASEPLYHRLTSIRDHLRADLRLALGEREARQLARASPPRWSLRSAVATLVGARG